MHSSSRHLPSKRFAIISIMTLSVLAAFLIVSKVDNTKQDTQKELSTSPAQNNLADLAYQNDADKDGLKDWEEILWGTDPKNSDSDGDKTSDGKEVALNRNPLKAGPDDDLTELDIQKLARAESTGSELAPIDIAAREFFSNFMRLKQGGTLSPEEVEALSESFSANILASIRTEDTPKYTKDDLLISQSTSAEALRKYGNDLATIIKKYGDKGSEVRTSMEIAQQAYLLNSEKELARLDPIIVAHKQTIDAAIALPVPVNMQDKHLALVNSLDNFLFSLQRLRESFENPLASIEVSHKYQKQTLATLMAFQNINTTFQEYEILYDPSEPGYLFTSIGTLNENSL